jgi:SAM-dependent methyltransferase
MSAAANDMPTERNPRSSDAVALAHGYDARSVREAALGYLDVEPSDRVLEIGFGDCELLEELTARASQGVVTGIDASERTLRHATKRSPRLAGSDRLTLVEEGSAGLQIARDSDTFEPFDKVLGLHVVYFFTNARQDLAEIHRVLRPGGRVVLGFCPGLLKRLPGLPEAATPRLEDLLAKSGFDRIEINTRIHGGGPITWIAAHRSL